MFSELNKLVVAAAAVAQCVKGWAQKQKVLGSSTDRNMKGVLGEGARTLPAKQPTSELYSFMESLYPIASQYPHVEVIKHS